jgi:two-component system phosphate regulon response regulator OmpR
MPKINVESFGAFAPIKNDVADSFDRAIDLRVTRLRRKIERDPAHPETIRTVRGVGYMFVPGTE